MSTKTLLHQARLNEWAVRITDQKSSGLSVTEWCQRNNLSKYKFFTGSISLMMKLWIQVFDPMNMV